MRGSRVVVVLVGIAVVAVLGATATSSPVDYAERSPSLPWRLPEFELGIDLPEPQPNDEAPDESEEESSSIVDEIAALLVLAAVAFALGRAIGVHRFFERPEPEPTYDDFDVLDDRLDEVAAALVDDADQIRATLATGEPRNAIVRCWTRLEGLVVRCGVARQPSDTPADLTARTLAAFDIDPAAIESLAALYREARFSSHAIGEAQRAAALDALSAVHAGLDRRTSARGTSAG